MFFDLQKRLLKKYSIDVKPFSKRMVLCYVTLKLNIMKNIIFKLTGLAFLLVMVISCDKEESNEQSIDEVNTYETELTAKVDNATEVISDTFLQIFEDEESPIKLPRHRFLPDCATVTVQLTNTSKEVVVNFGTEGCELKNGHIVSGIVTMVYNLDTDASTLVINYALENLYVDGINFEGSRTVIRQKSNENGNPQYAMEMQLIVTFADGTEVSRSGNKTREWIEGSMNGNWGDNVFLITGSWETNFANGTVHSTTITNALRREASCRFIVSGTVDLVRSLYSGSLDYGDGSCDNLAIFTNASGEEREISL